MSFEVALVAVEQQHLASTEISQTTTRMCAEDVVAVLKQLVLQTLRPAEGQPGPSWLPWFCGEAPIGRGASEGWSWIFVKSPS